MFSKWPLFLREKTKLMAKDVGRPILAPSQITGFEKYARLEISFDELLRELSGLIEFSFDRENEWVSERYRIPRPGVTVTCEHVQNALTKWRAAQVGEPDMVRWARVLLMSEVYEIDRMDQDIIGDSLADISYGDFPR